MKTHPLLSRLSTGAAALALLAVPSLAHADTAPEPGASTVSATVGQPAPASAPAGSWLAETPTTIDETALAELEIAEPGAGYDYDRDAFGTAWADVDENGCGTRDDILARDMTEETFGGEEECEVRTGTLEDPYSGETIDFDKSEGSYQIDIDHLIPLGAAWEAGADEWTDEERLAYANDPAVLLAVNAGDNRSKSDATIGEWMPDNEAISCQYSAQWVEISVEYELSVSEEDHQVLSDLAEECA